MPETVQVVFDKSGEVIRNLRDLSSIHVMVGVPEDRTERRDDAQITNAALAYIHNFGSPIRHIPPRPFMYPGIREAQKKIVVRYKSALRAGIDGNRDEMIRQLAAAGLAAQIGVQRKITTGPFKPLAASTIAARKRKLRGTKPLTATQRNMGFSDIKPLIDTGQLRRSITFVIRHRNTTLVEGAVRNGS